MEVHAMSTESPPPRITPLPESEWTEEQRALLSRGTADGEPRRNNWFSTLVRHPKVYKHWSAYGSALLYRGLLSNHDREVVVLRNASLLDAGMQFTEHARIALEEGMSRDALDAIDAGSEDPRLDAWDRTLTRATEELHRDHVLSDDTWNALAERLDDRQMIELIMLVGSYATMAWLQNSLRVEYSSAGVDIEAGASDQYHRDAASIGSRREQREAG
jgi:alkylhydroperoxidase family enzyme